MKHDIDKVVQVAQRAVHAAAKPIKEYFRQCRTTHAEKDEKSALVTAADIAAEKAMRLVIESSFPDHAIKGEELADKPGNSDYLWVLDPIDGTSNFAMGKPIFGTLISVIHKGRPILGIIYQPILDELFLGVTGKKTLLNGGELSSSQENILGCSLMATNPPYMFESDFERSVLWGLHQRVRASEFGGDCYNYAMLAAGCIDLVLVSGDDFHDFAAVIPIVQGAGGMITDWDGADLAETSTGHIVAAANSAIHRAALDAISHQRAG